MRCVRPGADAGLLFNPGSQLQAVDACNMDSLTLGSSLGLQALLQCQGEWQSPLPLPASLLHLLHRKEPWVGALSQSLLSWDQANPKGHMQPFIWKVPPSLLALVLLPSCPAVLKPLGSVGR